MVAISKVRICGTSPVSTGACICSKPKTHLSDVRVTATLDEHYAEGVDVDVICTVCRGEVELALNDASGVNVPHSGSALAPTSSTNGVATKTEYE